MTDTTEQQPKHGVVFPQGSVRTDGEGIREFVEGITELGFDHLVVPDHVLGADPASHPNWTGVYDVNDQFHEPLVLFGFIAAFSSIEVMTGVLVLPQRQAALVAKQAAEVDLLTGGRIRLGVGIGWNQVEFEGMGATFESRGRRIEEQIRVMRDLWTRPVVSFDGEDHHIHGAGIAPLPHQQPIPIWLGAEQSPRAFERVGRLADGWVALGPPRPEIAAALRIIHEAAERAGRDPGTIGVEAWVDGSHGDATRLAGDVRAWGELGATHIAVNTRRGTGGTLRQHLELLRTAAEAF
jgi:probable F420-dependent oxidoreductase